MTLETYVIAKEETDKLIWTHSLDGDPLWQRLYGKEIRSAGELLLGQNSGKIPWHWRNRWQRVVSLVKQMKVAATHIFIKGNCVADKLANRASSS